VNDKPKTGSEPQMSTVDDAGIEVSEEDLDRVSGGTMHTMPYGDGEMHTMGGSPPIV